MIEANPGPFTCSNCGRPSLKGDAFSVFWPSTTWVELGEGIHTVHYENGPVPFVEVREVGQTRVGQNRNGGYDGQILWCGKTMLLDCGRKYEVRPPVNAYGVTDQWWNLSASGGASGAVNAACNLFLNVDPDYSAPADISLDWGCVVNFDAANNTVLDMPWRNVVRGSIHMESSGLVGNAQVTPAVRGDPRGAVTSQPSGAITALTTNGQYRGILVGDWSTSNILGATATLFGGQFDRLIITLDGTAGTSGSLTIAIAIYAELYGWD